MIGAIITALIGLVGVLVGSFAQRFYQHRKFLSDSRYETYLLFLKSLAGTGATEPGSERRWEAVAGLIEAKSRIALFGSEQVVASLASFSGSHRRVTTENFDELAMVISFMREDVGADRIDGLEENLRGLLLEVGN